MSGAQRHIRVLIINHPAHRLVGEALAVVLRADTSLDVLAVLEHPLEALQYLETHKPDVGLVNCLGHRSHATQSTATLQAALPGLRIIILAAAIDHEVLAGCAQAGAAGYLTSEASAAELTEAIKRVYQGEVVFPVDGLLASMQRSHRRADTPALTAREQHVLQALADGLTVDHIADQMAITAATVRTHLKNAMAKLGTRSRLEAVLVGLKTGIIALRTSSPE